MRAELNVPKGYNPWSKMNLQIQGLNCTARVSALLNLMTATVLKGQVKSKKETLQLMGNMVIDISQNPCRRCWTPPSGTNHTLCTSSWPLHMGKLRAVLPAELFAWQGHNIMRTKFPKGMTNKKIKTLAGEGMFLPSLGTVIFSLLLTGSFEQPAGPLAAPST